MTLREFLTTDSPRIGLVLGGGGAKGAYQIGVLRYLLKEVGIENFELIAGTSIGSLNALLIATATPDDAEKVWRELGSALQPGVNTARAILWHAGLYGALFLPTLLAGVFTIWFAASWFGLSQELAQASGPSTVEVSFIGLLCSIIGVMTVGYHLRTFEFFGRVHAFTFNPAAAFFFPGVALFVALSWAGPLILTSYSLAQVLIWAFSAFGFWSAWTVGIFFVSNRARAYSLFDNSEVRRMIEEKLKAPKNAWRCKRILATVARERQFYHPAIATDEYSESWKRKKGEADHPGKLVTRWVPAYVDLMQIPYPERVATLLDTCAIPIAFPIRRDQRGFWTTDGGIVDNLPVSAALNMGDCDIIFVIPANQNEMPKPEHRQAFVDEHWAQVIIPTLTAQEKQALIRDAETGDGAWMPLLPGRRDVKSTRFVVVEPSRPLCTVELAARPIPHRNAQF